MGSEAGQSRSWPVGKEAISLWGRHTVVPVSRFFTRQADGGDSVQHATCHRPYTPAGVRQLRGLKASQTEQWSDPRLAGTSLLVHNEHEYPELMGPKWGTTRTENDGGAWVGSYLGMELPRADGPDIPVYLTTMVGEGGYEGLSALCYTVYPGGPGWDGESECIVFEGPVPQIGGLPSE
jgi:hypothetical protein